MFNEHPFEKILSAPSENILLELKGFEFIAWSEFILNPRRLRGSDFLMRWSQGVWSERRLMEAINATDDFFAIPYGPSGTAPKDDVRAFELYFERLEKAGIGNIKRPDLLIFHIKDKVNIENVVTKVGGLSELPFLQESEIQMILDKALIGVECENSLWRAEKMPDFEKPLRPQRRLEGKPGLKKNAVLPTIIVKEEDRSPLRKWQTDNNIPIHIWHVFYERGYGIGFDKIEKLIAEGLILPTEQIFQAPGGATTRKSIYKVYHHYSYPLGITKQEPLLLPAFVEDANGHILPYVRFEGGSLDISKECIEVLKLYDYR